MENHFKTNLNQDKTATTSMELLCPAGSLDSFHAAVEAGANAVYLGLPEFNARLRAKNFSIKTLSFLVPFAHQKKIRIYITLNTLIKQQELELMIDVLHQLEQLKIDGIIVQDLGLVKLAHTFFPRLTLHASTQMALHNSMSINEAQTLGIKRMILPRELTLEEIRAIREKTSAELELFIHGALCYSISGMCLASSFLGGASGNRGRCTQACRRLYTHEKRSGFYFSPGDFWAIDFLEKFRELGISALKIEGRMKGAEYVYRTVSLYRQALDHPDQIPAIKEELSHDFGRRKTAFFLSGVVQQSIIQPDAPSGNGTLLGTVLQFNRESFKISTETPLEPGDRIRFQSRDGEDGFHVRVIALQKEGQNTVVFCNHDSHLAVKDQVYLISKKSAVNHAWSKIKMQVRPYIFSHLHRNQVQRILTQASPKSVTHRTGTHKKSTLFVSFNTIQWLKIVDHESVEGIILHLSKTDADFLKTHITQFSPLKKKLILSLPPFIPEADLGIWKDFCTRVAAHGFTQWMVAHLGQKNLIPARMTLFAGSTLWTLNRIASSLLAQEGFTFYTYSPEDDILNLKSIIDTQGLLTVYGLTPLFISRIEPPLRNNSTLIDSKNENFIFVKYNHLYYLLGAKPFSLTHRKDKLEEIGISNFILDFSFQQPDKSLYKNVFFSFQRNQKMTHTSLFNHKAGLK